MLNEDEGASLPKGKCCGDCRSFEICVYLVGTVATAQICDWNPSRFAEGKNGVK